MALRSHKISLVINTKNEEKNIKDCINSAKHLADEIIVVDMHSSDNTVQIAKKLGAKVFSTKDVGYVEPARKLSISKATYNWILLMDADQRMTHSLGSKLKKIAGEDKYDVVRIPRRNIIFGKWIRHAWWWPDYHEWFFKKDFVDWSKTIHSAPKTKGRILTLPAKSENAFVHYNYASIDQFINRMNRYTSFTKGIDKRIHNAKDLVQYPKNEFAFRYIHQEGYKDKLHGYFLCKLMEFYRFVELAKYWESKSYGEIVDSSRLYKIILSDQSVTEVEKLKHQVYSLTGELDTIKSSKFFRLWQSYCRIRDNFFDHLH